MTATEEERDLIADAEITLGEGVGLHSPKARQLLLLESIARSMLALAKMAFEEREG